MFVVQNLLKDIVIDSSNQRNFKAGNFTITERSEGSLMYFEGIGPT